MAEEHKPAREIVKLEATIIQGFSKKPDSLNKPYYAALIEFDGIRKMIFLNKAEAKLAELSAK